MNCYCEGTLGGICRFAESLRPRLNPRVQHNMDAYLLGNPTPARIVLMMFHNQHYHHVPVIQQAMELEHLMAARAQSLQAPNNFRNIAQRVQIIMRQVANDPTKQFEMALASLNW
ncbi:hypothetical protein CAEBREN_22244 [Caenorhabditis brenneri]|uniref:Uncharacterized protein n=1 Tax=Caenorhabditis brenneri TaxID=135651 RepID=G0MYB9_CAEBE|nr:hypothetical protein CAEBREN_22244 [Caenorhabditis brenneri]